MMVGSLVRSADTFTVLTSGPVLNSPQVDLRPSYILVEHAESARVEARINAAAMIFFNLSFLLISRILPRFYVLIGFGRVLSRLSFVRF